MVIHVQFQKHFQVITISYPYNYFTHQHQFKKGKLTCAFFMSMIFILIKIKLNIDINNDKLIDNRMGNIIRRKIVIGSAHLMQNPTQELIIYACYIFGQQTICLNHWPMVIRTMAKPLKVVCLFCFLLMRSTEPQCFRSCSWSLWKLLRRRGASALVSWRLDLLSKSS